MKKLLILFVLFLVLIPSNRAWCLDKEEEIKILKEQVKQLLERIEKLEKEQKEKKDPVCPAFDNSRLILKGRFFTGYYKGERNGSKYEKGSFEVPDGKIQFIWKINENIEVIDRISLNNAQLGIDYFYFQKNGIIPNDSKSRLRIGRFKVNFGEETWFDNPVENKFITNSASSVGGYDEGIELYGNFIPDKFGYVLSLTNGTTGVGLDKTSSKAFSVKIFGKPFKSLYLSGSYYTSGDLDEKGADMKIAGLTTPPTGVTKWERDIWEFDTKFSLKKFEISAAYGKFLDNFIGSKRQGNYYFIQGIYNFTDRFYFGLRYSEIGLNDGLTAKLNDIEDVNKYIRSGIVCGYKINSYVTLKGEYCWNKAKNQNIDINDNQFAIGIATHF